MVKLKIAPINFEDPGFLKELIPDISKITGFNVLFEDVSLNTEDYYEPRRGQCDASKILNSIKQNTEMEKVILFTSVDLFIPIFTFVFGLAKLMGNAAIISIHRLKNEFYGLPPNPQLLKQRLIKETIHELGHLGGLRHCSDYYCVMASSTNTDELDVKGVEYCSECSNKFFDNLKLLNK